MGDQPYNDRDPDDLEENPTWEDPPLFEEEAVPLGNTEDYEMPTRRIVRDDYSGLEETRLSAAVPDDLPADEPFRYEDYADADRVQSPLFEAEEDIYPPLPADPDLEETVLRVPLDAERTRVSSPPVYTPRADIPPSGPPVQAAPLPSQPPIYGGFADRPSVIPPPISESPLKRRRTARERRDNGLYFPWWSLLILLAGVALVAALIIMGLSTLGGRFLPGGETPVVIVVTSTATRPAVTPSPTAAVTLGATPTRRAPTATTPSALTTDAPPEGFLRGTVESVITPAPEALALRVGVQVEVFDVGAIGLNVREGPGTSYPVQLIASEGSVYELVDGPEESDEYTWWRIESVDDPDIEGWAIAEYLRVVR